MGSQKDQDRNHLMYLVGLYQGMGSSGFGEIIMVSKYERHNP